MTLWRGITMQLTEAEEQVVKDGLRMATTREETKLVDKIGPMLVAKARLYEHNSGFSGLGRHWTTKRDWAEKASTSGRGGGYAVLLEANWNGQGEDLEKTNTGMQRDIHGEWLSNGEEEVTMLQSANPEIVCVYLRTLGEYRNVWNGAYKF